MESAYRPSAEEVAMLVVLMIQRYSQERGRDVSRFRMARASLRRLAIRDRLRDALVEDWIDVMALDYDWIVFTKDEEFLLLKAETTRTWTKIATKRCDDLIKRLRNGDSSAIRDGEKEIDPPPRLDDSEDDD